MVQQSETLSPFLAGFDAARRGLPGAGRPWAEALRAGGLARFSAAGGLPTRKVEAWKYTDLKKLAKLSFAPAPRTVDGVSAPLQDAVAAARAAAHAIVFINGHFRPDLSRLDRLPPGARLAGLAALLESDDPLPAVHLGKVAEAGSRPFLDLNTALMQDGFVLHLAPGTVVEAPIRVVSLTDHAGELIAFHPRNLVVAEAGSQATLVEEHRGTDGANYFSNGVTELLLADGARLHHYKLQQEGAQGFHLALVLARLLRDATYDNFILSTGAELARNEIYALLDGRGADCRLAGAYLGRDRQHLDTTTLIDHAQPDGRSREVYKGVLDGTARGVFQGKILVRRGAQRTDGYQLNRALLLSRGAEIDSKPELEIYADDVKCSHGATAGEIDEQALFYLRSRGIGAAEARALLVEAFIREAIEEIAVEPVRDAFSAVVTGWLNRRKEA